MPRTSKSNSLKRTYVRDVGSHCRLRAYILLTLKWSEGRLQLLMGNNQTYLGPRIIYTCTIPSPSNGVELGFRHGFKSCWWYESKLDRTALQSQRHAHVRVTAGPEFRTVVTLRSQEVTVVRLRLRLRLNVIGSHMGKTIKPQ